VVSATRHVIAMTGYRLRDGVSFCRVSGTHVFLDLLADRYFGLSDRLNHIFERIVAGEMVSRCEAAPLLRSGLLLACDTDARPLPCNVTPLALSDAARLQSRVRLRSIAGALVSRARWTLRVKRRGLAENIAAFERWQHQGCKQSPSSTALTEMVRSYDLAALLWSERDRCLPNALALAHDLTRHGLVVQLVFAIRIDPFQAHCWIQCGGTPLRTDPDVLRGFTPILVV
jgi:Transglutaminase-like superfamily